MQYLDTNCHCIDLSSQCPFQVREELFLGTAWEVSASDEQLTGAP